MYFISNLIPSSAIPGCEQLGTQDFQQLKNLCDVDYGQIWREKKKKKKTTNRTTKYKDCNGSARNSHAMVSVHEGWLNNSNK